MLSLDGYNQLKLLRATARSSVYEGVRACDGLAVIIKLYESDREPSFEARVEHEFRLIERLENQRVIRALALEHSGDGLALVMERHRGINLEEFCGGQAMALNDFLEVARQLAEILAEVHAQRVIHRDVKPSNILIDPESLAVVLADFGISVLLEGERSRINDPEVLEGSLPYVSPEQTGRTDARVDFRTDLYSLGVTLYELATGERPFVGGTSLELLHAHLARRPRPPQVLRPDLPTQLSDLIMKLLEKAPERRYQSAQGLAVDLVEIAEARKEGRALEGFELARSDVSLALVLPHALYGREVEVARLLSAFRRAATGMPSLILIEGPPGIGKSALLSELIEPVLGRRGFIARGKFEQGNEKPFSAVVSALASIADQLLIETEENLEQWRTRLRAALGGLASVLVDLVPKFGPVFGDMDVEVEGEGLEVERATRRVKLAFSRLLGAVARPEHPLVLALDDLQWVDEASCGVIDDLLDSRDLALLIVGTVRDAELGRGHELLELEANLNNRGMVIEHLKLGPIDARALTKLVADVLLKPRAEVRSLVKVITRKTGSNPFFVRQFLLQLAELGLLYVGPTGWTWDAARIEAAALPEDSLAIMGAKLERLTPLARGLLAAAAVLGGRFDAPSLIEVMASASADTETISPELGLSLGVVAQQLQELIDEGLIAHVEGGYVFGHDRIREAAYSLSTDRQKRRNHLVVGHYLSAELGVAGELTYATQEGSLDSERWFELADHLGRGHGLLPLADARKTGGSMSVPALRQGVASDAQLLVEVNLRAGRRALRTGAARAALRYLELADSMVANIASPREGLEFEVKLCLGQATGLCGQHQQSAAVLDELLARPLDAIDYGEAVIQRLLMASIGGRREDALALGLEGLRRLGFRLRRKPSGLELGRALASLAWHLRPARLSAFETMRPVKDPRLLAAMEICVSLRNIAYLLEPELWVVLVAKQVRMMARHGRHPSMPLVLMQGALVMANVTNKRALARERCVQLMALDERLGASKRRAQAGLLDVFVGLWLTPLREQLPQIRRVGVAIQEAGDLENATFALVVEQALCLYGGAHLRVVETSMESACVQIDRWGTREIFVGGAHVEHFCTILMQGPLPSCSLREEFQPLLPTAGMSVRSSVTRLESQLLIALLACLLSRYDECAELLELCAAPLERGAPGTWVIPVLRALEGLCAAVALGEAEELDAQARRRLRRRLSNRRDSLRALTNKGCVFEHLASLLEAEAHVLAGQFAQAGRAYQRAADAAHEQQNPIFEALACERMASVALDEENDAWAVGPARRARERYRSWGAHAKVEQLEARWPWIGEEGSLSIQVSTDSTSDIRAIRINRPKSGTGSMRTSGSSSPKVGPTTGVTTNLAVDMATIFKAWQAIAADIQLNEVVDRVMQIAIENAGAERGALTLANEGRLELVAEVLAEGETQLSFGQGLMLSEISDRLPVTLLRWVARTREPLVIANVREDRRFRADAFVASGAQCSVLCLPIIKRDRLVGLLYLENKLNPGNFTSERLETLELLMSHAASALENARLYEALRSSEVRWRLLVGRLPDVVALLDRRGCVEFINLALDRRARRELHGTAWMELVGASRRESATQLFTALLAGQAGLQQMHQLELELELPGRGLRWYETRIVPIVVDGRLERVIVVAHDLTRRHEREREKRELEGQLRQQQRLEAIGTLASGVAHEINNPMQGIRGYAELIAGSADANEEIREFAGEIEHESKRVTNIVRNLLAFSRQERAAGMERVAVAGVISETLSLARTIVRKDAIQLELDLPDDLEPVYCRSQQIQQVVLNLITNARDALNTRYPQYDPNKRIELRARSFAREAVQWVAIEVEDHGGGVPDAVVEQIFDPFFTTKDRDHGTGLGLSVSHGIINEHRGQLRLDNRPGEGACFIIELPCNQPVLDPSEDSGRLA